MSSITEIETVPVIVESVDKKPKAKPLTAVHKRMMCGILSFMAYLEEKGVIDEFKLNECLNELPLYKTAAMQREFFEQEIFDPVMIEKDMWKP